MTDRREKPLVMVVEDSDDAMQIMMELLPHHGFRVDGVGNGGDAIIHAHTIKPDLVLLDLSIPVLDGWGVARALRSDLRTQSIPILALTAHATPVHLDRARASGCDAVLVKPVVHEELISEMKRLITRRDRELPRVEPPELR